VRPNPAIRADSPTVTVYLDARPLSSDPLTGIGRYTARTSMALAAAGARVRFFVDTQELIPLSELDWSPDQELQGWWTRLWRGARFVSLADIPDAAVGLWTYLRPSERTFSIELSVLHDFAPLIVPAAHNPQTKPEFEFFVAKSLLSSHGALAISHSTKADAGWLSDFPQDRTVVAHSGPSQCLHRHLHDGQVTRRSNVGLMVSTLEPRKNSGFVLDWFRTSELLPDGTELWWVNRNGWPKSPRLLEDLRRGHKERPMRLFGCVTDQQLCELYQTAGWSIYPSLYSGFGSPVLDSLRHGVPVLSSCNSSLSEFAYAGVHFFDPLSKASLDRAWAECRAAGPNVVSKGQLDEHYNWDKVARVVLEMARSARSPARTSILTRERHPAAVHKGVD
jgi:glycosyltransferase involved in cell wall biosynthesis